jgi:3-methyl-2-oxobutanoate hydroxymethyltransferase
MSIHADSKPWTVPALAEAKRNGQKLVMLTAYDAGFARSFDANGVDLILVGDSLGMVVQGHDSTLPVSVEDVVYHTRAVASVLQRALLVSDLPFGADATPERALEASLQLLKAGAEMVKIEGAGFKLDIIRHLVEREIPVCSHLGLTPQSVLRLGGYRVQGRGDAARQLLDDAKAVAEAGASLLVLECVPTPLAGRVTAETAIPTIGIGAGPECDGQVLVLHDFLAEGGSVAGAVRAYADAVRAGTFPDAEHAYAS